MLQPLVRELPPASRSYLHFLLHFRLFLIIIFLIIIIVDGQYRKPGSASGKAEEDTGKGKGVRGQVRWDVQGLQAVSKCRSFQFRS